MKLDHNQAMQTRLISPKILATALTALIVAAAPLASWSEGEAVVVKMSQSGVCHDASSRHYARVKNFKPYDSIQACLDDGGRKPKK
ncbi:MAG: hypothetical protein GTO41_21745 [Burkholderiales bacterium]|nr:hypothetical protein [Burkholderiales bacterium]